MMYIDNPVNNNKSDQDDDDENANEKIILFEETVTTVPNEKFNGYYAAEFEYDQTIRYNIIYVTFDDVEYTCSRYTTAYYGGFYGGSFGFVDYPFAIISTGDTNFIVTPTEGSHNIVVKIIPNDDDITLNTAPADHSSTFYDANDTEYANPITQCDPGTFVKFVISATDTFLSACDADNKTIPVSSAQTVENKKIYTLVAPKTNVFADIR